MATSKPITTLIKNQEGFTLIEILMALVITSIVVGAAYSLFSLMTRSFTSQEVTAAVQQQLRLGVDFITRDIRATGFDPTGETGAGVLTATATSFQFTADRDENGSLAELEEDVTYTFNAAAGRLERVDANSAFGTEVLIENVDVANSGFSYFDDSSPPVATVNPDDIRTIIIAMTVVEPAGRAAPVRRTLSARVTARNLGLQ